MLKFLLAIPAAYLLGFMLFLVSLPPTPEKVIPADGIVALTGGDTRLDVAVSLLEEKKAKRLLITGVHNTTTRADLRRLVGGSKRFDCCTDLGYAALTTHGNAAETANWAKAHGYKSLIVVTARYHMPRSLTEFHASMKDVKLEPYPVDPASIDLKQWWHDPRVLKLLHYEYAKYLASVAVTNVMGPEALNHASLPHPANS